MAHKILCANKEIVSVYSDALVSLDDLPGHSTITRASHVEPAQDGSWVADLRPSGGPVLSGFKLRSEALQAELDWLDANIIDKQDASSDSLKGE